jgi:hypothetical protein
MDRGRIASFAALALAASALSACNVVATKEPLFTPADASPLKLHDGVWAPADDQCRFDETKPVDAWPDCAQALLVRDGEFLTWQADSKTWRSDTTGKILIVAGDPMIIEARDTPQNSEPVYVYAGFTPRTDAQGRIVGVQVWPVLCGPPPPGPKGAPATQAATKAPFPGMTMNAKGQTCTTGDPNALRSAARASKGLATTGLASAHWVRDGER